MPSTYTGTGIELIGDGEQSGSWGTTTNNNMQILNRLISEAGVIALTGTTHALTISDGTLSDGQYAVLVFGGSPSGTNTVTISPNDAKRVFIVSNTSGQSVVLTQGSGGNVTVLNGRTALVYSDGAGSGAAVVNVSDNLITPTLNAIGLLTPTDGNFVVGNGSTWVAESGNTVLQSLGVTATATELNVLDGITASTAELNYTDGVTANIQTQLDVKAAVTTSISAGAGLTGGGTLEANRTISHADTSSQTSVDNSGTTVIQDVTLDTYGHVTALGSKTLALTDFNVTATSSELNVLDGITATTAELNYTDGVTSNIQTQLDTLTTNKADKTTTVSAGSGLTGGGDLSANRTISHSDTSSQSSVNNSGTTVIQDVTLDTYGHVTALGSKTLALTDFSVTASASAINTAASNYVPSGGIIMWSGSVASIPSGWFLCNGSNGTPDLRDRFVVGAGNTYAVGATGGAASVTLTSSEIPGHTHSFSATTGSNGSHTHTASTGSNGAHTHDVSGTTSTDGAHTHTIPNGGGQTGFDGLESGFSASPPVSTSSAGSHSHTITGTAASAGAHTHTVTVDSAGAHTHSVSGTTGSTGGGDSHENRPPYYALAYIMKA